MSLPESMRERIREHLFALIERSAAPALDARGEQALALATMRRACQDLFVDQISGMIGTRLQSKTCDYSARRFLCGEDETLFHELLGIDPEWLAGIVRRIPAE